MKTAEYGIDDCCHRLRPFSQNLIDRIRGAVMIVSSVCAFATVLTRGKTVPIAMPRPAYETDIVLVNGYVITSPITYPDAFASAATYWGLQQPISTVHLLKVNVHLFLGKQGRQFLRFSYTELVLEARLI